LGDEINLSVVHEFAAVELRLTGQGLREILKAVVKYLPSA